MFLDLKVEIVTCGTSYKFTLLKRYIRRSSREIGHNTFLENLISIRLVALEKGHRGILQGAIPELENPKLQSYSHFKIELLKSRKGNMRKFDGKDPVNWILQMEQYFDLHEVKLLKKVRIASSYLEPGHFLWYKGLCSCKALVTWSIFTEEMIAHYEDTKSNTFFSQLINLKQKGSMVEHIEDFQKLNIRLNDIRENK